YAHARISSLLKNAMEKKIAFEGATLKSISQAERDIVRELDEFPDVILNAVEQKKPQKLCNYAYSLSEKFHAYYTDHRIVDPENLEVSRDRLKLSFAVKNVLEVTLSLIGVSAPDEM
ncbi:DALR anticodon-binding domain-containing protein, partial [Athalassotoga sp.]